MSPLGRSGLAHRDRAGMRTRVCRPQACVHPPWQPGTWSHPISQEQPRETTPRLPGALLGPLTLPFLRQVVSTSFVHPSISGAAFALRSPMETARRQTLTQETSLVALHHHLSQEPDPPDWGRGSGAPEPLTTTLHVCIPNASR